MSSTPPAPAYEVVFEDGQHAVCRDLDEVRAEIEGYYPLVEYRDDAAYSEVDGRQLALIRPVPPRPQPT